MFFLRASIFFVSAPEPRRVTRAGRIIAGNLRVDWATAEVLRAFRASGVESVLLKGASVARWLHEADDPRPYNDCDLLVRPLDLSTAEKVLLGLGFESGLNRHEMPDWWQEHAVGWGRRADGAVMDLHRAVPGLGVDPDEQWLRLSENTEPIVIADFEARALTIPGRAFLLALHAAHHGVGWGRVLTDLERGLASADRAAWTAAAELASALDAMPAFTTGLRLVPAGSALVRELELPTDSSAEAVLKASAPPPIALGFDQLARAENWRARARILRHKAVPPVTFMRAWSIAQWGQIHLIRAYIVRPFWLLAKAPAGFRAWHEARRATQR